MIHAQNGRRSKHMNKSILDEILVDKNLNPISKIENEKLYPLIDEINLISDDAIKSFVRSVLFKAENFWDIPSSFSGKYHPKDEHGVGGNVIHTKRVARIAAIFADSYTLSEEERDIVIAACLLHDVCKGVKDSQNSAVRYDPMHSYTVGKFIEKCRLHDKKTASESDSSTLYLSEDVIQSILRLVRCHLGPWSPVPETYPITYLDFIVHLADNVASKIHLVIQDSDLINPKWKKDGSRSETKEEI
jgi:HD superfamily phosphohydrolase YqeK